MLTYCRFKDSFLHHCIVNVLGLQHMYLELEAEQCLGLQYLKTHEHHSSDATVDSKFKALSFAHCVDMSMQNLSHRLLQQCNMNIGHKTDKIVQENVLRCASKCK